MVPAGGVPATHRTPRTRGLVDISDDGTTVLDVDPVTERRWAAVPAARLSERQLRWRVRVIVTAVVLAALTGPLALVVSAGTSARVSTLDEGVSRVVGRAVADATALAWMVGDPPPAPVAEGVTVATRAGTGAGLFSDGWRGPWWSDTQVTRPRGRVVEYHRYLVVDGDGRRLRLVVPVGLDAAGGSPTVVAAPYLEPWPPYDPLPRLGAGGATSTTPGPAVFDRLAEWAAAWLADDQRALLALTGDTSSPVGTYRGIGGLEPGGPLAVRFALLSSDERQMLVRVEVPWRTGAATGTLEADVLVADHDTSLPRPVAWGPAGSGFLGLLSPGGSR